MNYPRITVVTPCYNSASTLRETLESVRSQDYPNLEHLVMDGGSKDGTLEILREFPHLQFISEKDDGHYHAMNKGIEKASGDIVAILNADDCYRPGALRKIGEAMAAHPEWDGLFTDVVYVDKDSQVIFTRKEAGYDYETLRFGDACYVVHPTLFLRRSVYRELGAYKHKEYLNCCDLELILRLGKAGKRIGHIPEFLVNYRIHGNGQSADLRVVRNMAKESRRIRTEHGCPEGVAGKVAGFYARVRRQTSKLLKRGTCDLIPGWWRLNPHLQSKTEFSSNIGIHELKH